MTIDLTPIILMVLMIYTGAGLLLIALLSLTTLGLMRHLKRARIKRQGLDGEKPQLTPPGCPHPQVQTR